MKIHTFLLFVYTNELCLCKIVHRILGCEDVTKRDIEEWLNNVGRNKFSDKEIVCVIHEKIANARMEATSDEESWNPRISHID